jgi:APA family basic amino acid/polyamine antiporter
MTDAFDRVLLPVASREDATASARALRPRTGASVVAVHVIEKAGGALDKASVEQREAVAAAIFETVYEELDDITAVEETILAAVDEYDTICVGAIRTGPVSQAVFGSLPETVGEETDRTVLMARGPEESAMSVREAIARRLEV